MIGMSLACCLSRFINANQYEMVWQVTHTHINKPHTHSLSLLFIMSIRSFLSLTVKRRGCVLPWKPGDKPSMLNKPVDIHLVFIFVLSLSCSWFLTAAVFVRRIRHYQYNDNKSTQKPSVVLLFYFVQTPRLEWLLTLKFDEDCVMFRKLLNGPWGEIPWLTCESEPAELEVCMWRESMWEICTLIIFFLLKEW